MGIQKFDKTNRSLPRRKAHWPDSPETTESVFDRRQPLRKLRVMIDHEIFDEDTKRDVTKAPTKEILLRSLLYNDTVELFRYVVDTPPESAQKVQIRDYLEPAYVGYVVLHTDTSRGFWPVSHSLTEKTMTSSSLRGNMYEAAFNDESNRIYTGKDAADRRKTDMLALQVAQECLEADIYITRRPYLLDGSPIVRGRGVTVCTPEDAISAVGLYLRAQYEFVIPTGEKKFTMTLNRGLFFWVGTRELLPEGWRWFSACVHHSKGAKDDKLQYLGGATLSRVQRALELRDQVYTALNSVANNDINDEALGIFDNVLTVLMGAVDATARVAHCVGGLDDAKANQAGWQREGWLKKLEKVSPELKKIIEPGTHNWHRLVILSKLRNSIHGEPIRAMTKQDSEKSETIIALPSDDEKDILASMDALGGRDAWGVKPLTFNFNEVQPGVLVDKLFEEVLTLLNDIMKNTPVENLDHLDDSSILTGPPNADKPGDPFSEWHRKTIGWQLGL